MNSISLRLLSLSSWRNDQTPCYHSCGSRVKKNEHPTNQLEGRVKWKFGTFVSHFFNFTFATPTTDANHKNNGVSLKSAHSRTWDAHT